MRLISLSRLDLPAPDAPTSATNWPWRTTRSMPARTGWPPSASVTPVNARASSGGGTDAAVGAEAIAASVARRRAGCHCRIAAGLSSKGHWPPAWQPATTGGHAGTSQSDRRSCCRRRHRSGLCAAQPVAVGPGWPGTVCPSGRHRRQRLGGGWAWLAVRDGDVCRVAELDRHVLHLSGQDAGRTGLGRGDRPRHVSCTVRGASGRAGGATGEEAGGACAVAGGALAAGRNLARHIAHRLCLEPGRGNVAGNAGGATGIGGGQYRAFDAGAGLRHGAAVAGPQSRPLAGSGHRHAGGYLPAGTAGRQHDHRE